MSIESEYIEYINNYQPNEYEKGLLEKAGLTIEKAMQFNRPTAKEWKILQSHGFGLIEAILELGSLQINIKDALNQASALLMPVWKTNELDEKIPEAQTHAVEIISSRFQGNPFPGIEFSLEQAEEVLTILKLQKWNKTNLGASILQLRELTNVPTKVVKK